MAAKSQVKKANPKTHENLCMANNHFTQGTGGFAMLRRTRQPDAKLSAPSPSRASPPSSTSGPSSYSLTSTPGMPPSAPLRAIYLPPNFCELPIGPASLPCPEKSQQIFELFKIHFDKSV